MQRPSSFLHLVAALAALALGSLAARADVYELVPLANASWRFNQSSNLDGVNWTAPAYDDSGWDEGLSLLAFENNSAITPINTVLNDPRTAVDGVPGHAYYFRLRFNWPYPTNNVTLRFTCRIDDCAAFYLNGVLLTNVGVNTPITFASLGRGAIGGGTDADIDEVFAIMPASLVTGDNVLAVEVHQTTATSSDIVWGGRVEGEIDTTPPTMADTIPLPGSTVSTLTNVQVNFSEPVLGVDAADLLINGQPATNLVTLDAARYLFQFGSPATGQVQIAFAPAHGITDRAGFAFIGTNWTVRLDPRQPSQYAVAGTLYVDLRATNASAGTTTWTNEGTLGNFTRYGSPALVQDALGTGIPALLFNGTSDYYVGPAVPADIIGANDFSVEVWTLNPDLAAEETLVSWGRRGATRINNGLNFGSHLTWGCATYFNDDLGWGTVGNIPSAGEWHHLVLTYNGGTLTKMYVDGLMRAQKTLGGTLATEAAYALNLGCQRNNDGATFSFFYSGYINSVRIHSGLLSDAQVAMNYSAGPVAKPSAGPVQFTAQPQSLTVAEEATASFLASAGGAPPISLQWFRDGVLIPGATNKTCTLANAGFTDNGAQFFMVASNFDTGAPCTATSSVATLTVRLVADALQHRYSFDAGANDLAGAAHGQLVNGALITNGAVLLNGINQYVNLPNNLVTGYTALTIEMWATDNGSAGWARLFDFGNSSGGEDFPLGSAATGTQYMFLSLPSGLGNLRGAYTASGGGAGEQMVEWDGGRPPLGQPAHIVWTSDGATQAGRLYVDGVLVGANNSVTLTPAALGNTVNNWLGRSQFNDPLFNGSIAEFRIYDVALSANTIARHFLNGPDLPPMNGPVCVVVQPQSQTVDENQPVTFSPFLNGTQPFALQWYRNGLALEGATSRALTFVASIGDNGAVFQLWATNTYTNATFTAASSNAVLTVTADTNPPTLVRATSMGTSGADVVFSEPVREDTAIDLAHYGLTGPAGAVVIHAAVLDPAGDEVILSTDPLQVGATYVLTVNGLRDRAAAANLIPTNSQAAFVATPYTLSDLNDSMPAGTIYGATNGLFLTGGGADIGGAGDQFTFATETRTGDFDVQVRVAALSPTDVWSKAGLMARETLAPGSRFAAVLATPTMAGAFFEYRATNARPAVMSGAFPPNYPNYWLRLQRAGNQFTGYASYDGQMWTLLGAVNLALSNTLYFGLCLSSHANGVAAAAQFTDLGAAVSDAVGPTPGNREPPGPSTRRTGLVISEIMYRPAPRADGRIVEFIELYNSNPFFHDLSGHRLSGDVDFTFPSGTTIPGGGFVVVAANPADMEAVYGLTGVYGPYAQRLKTSGTLRLRDEQNAILLEVPYANARPWPMAADGTGHSIVLARPSFGEADPRAWDISDVVGGSPGAHDAFRPSPLRNVVINELLANAGPAEDFVELYNHSNASNDISGCVLTDNPGLNKFIAPPGTVIPPRGFLALTQTQLGFGLKGGGDTVYLKNPDGSRVLDAVRFDAQAEGVSLGRWPDGGSDLYPLALQTPGAPNSAIRVHDIVLNELMYHPISKNDDDQFIELYNQGTNTWNLSGWKFVAGVSFTFPSNAVIPAGGYLVVARNLTNLLAKYPALNSNNAFGDFDGRLSHAGERVALAMPQVNLTTSQGVVVTNVLDVVVDEVTYADGGRWGEWSDGGGSSLELTDPRSNHRLAANWADSDESAKAPWTTIQATGVLDNGANYTTDPVGFAQIGQIDPGECLIDDVEVLPQAGTPNYVGNPNFTSGLGYWSLLGCFSRSTLETGGGYGGSGNALRLRTGNRLFTIANAAQATLTTTTLSAGQTATLRFKARWLKGCPEIVMRLAGNWLEAAGAMPVPANLGSPGARNSRAVSNAPPAIDAVTHTPALPAENQPVFITARVHDPDGVANLTVQYRVDPSASYISLAMADNGTGGDAVAGDGVFSATVPGQPSGATVAFIVTTADARGATSQFPARLNNGGPDREGVVRWGEPNPTSAFGTYHFFLTQANVNRWMTLPVLSNEDIDGTLVYYNRVIYSIKARYAGSPYHQAFDGPAGNRACHYNCEVPADDKLLGHASFNKLHWIGNDIQDDTAAANVNDSTLQREQAAYTFLRGLGQPWVYRRYVAVYFNGVRRGQLMEDALRPSVSVPDEYFPDDPDGFLYKVQPWFEGGANANADTSWPWENKSWAYFLPYTTTGGAYKQARYRWCYEPRQSPDWLNNFTNLFGLITTATNYLDPNWTTAMENIADMENWVRLMAANHAAGNWDCWGIQNGQNIYAYTAPRTKWTLFMFDFSIVLGNRISWGPGANLEAIPSVDLPWQYIYGAGTGKGAFRRMYWRALKELVNRAMTPGAIEPLLDAKYAAFQASGIAATSPQPIKDWIAAARSSIASQVATRDTMQFTLATNWVQASNNLALLSGSAPLDVTTLEVGGALWPVTWSSTTAWTLQMPVVPGTNSFTVLGYDRHGRLVSGASNVVTVVNPVVPEPAAGNVVITEIMSQPRVPDAEFVELFNNSTNVAFDLSGWQFHGLDYTFARGAFLMPRSFLTLVKDRSAFAGAYGAATPVFDKFDGNLQSGGETLSLIQPGQTPAEAVVIDRVRYEAEVPWPAGATNGTSLQLLDSRQDNSRVSNWSDGSGWRFLTMTGSSGTGTGSRLSLYFESAGGNVYLDDLSLVPLSGAYAGSNLLRNADFELPLGTNTILGTNNWVTSAVTVASVVVSNLAHSGNSCLRFVMNPAAPQLTYFYQYLSAPLPPQTPFAFSFWYLSGTKGTNLSAYLNSAFRPAIRVTPPTPATPGASNSVTAALPEYPPLWLNEVQPLNATGRADNQGEREPWIELYNASTNRVPLEGLFLADNYTNLTQWAFPTGAVINPGEFKVVFADGEPGESTAEEWHTSFRLNSAGSVVLARLADGTPQIMDYLKFSGLAPDRSYGDYPDGQPFYRQPFDCATPGGTNNPASAPLVVFINEWMAGNTGFIRDPADNDTDDWFELYNPTATPVDLTDWFLSDTLANRTFYRVPAGYVVPANGFLLVWADSEPGQNSTNRPDLHVNFKLNNSGEAIVLSAPDGTLIDAVTFGPQTANLSEGRAPDGGEGVSILSQPTPRGANAIPAPAPVFLSVVPGNPMVLLTLETVSNFNYHLEVSPTLDATNWLPLGLPERALGPTLILPDSSATNAQRFYRAVRTP